MITFLQLQNKPPKRCFFTLKNHLFSISDHQFRHRHQRQRFALERSLVKQTSEENANFKVEKLCFVHIWCFGALLHELTTLQLKTSRSELTAALAERRANPSCQSLGGGQRMHSESFGRTTSAGWCHLNLNPNPIPSAFARASSVSSVYRSAVWTRALTATCTWLAHNRIAQVDGEPAPAAKSVAGECWG